MVISKHNLLITMEQKRNIFMNEGFSDFPSYVERSSPKPKLLLIFIIVLLIIIAALAALYFLGANNKQEVVQSIPAAPTPTSPPVQSQPTITSVVSQPPLDRSTLTVAILNGSGTAGAAKGISSYLNGLGYNVGTVGNADNFTYTGITVHVRKSKSSYLSQLENDLKTHEPNASISASVDDTIATDAEVIVGK
jgi:cytoskeletal protein RodZ